MTLVRALSPARATSHWCTGVHWEGTPHRTDVSATGGYIDGQRPHPFLPFSAFSLHRVPTPDMPHSTVEATDETRTDVLTAEVRPATVEQIAPGATVRDLMSAEQDCATKSVEFAPLLRLWLQSHTPGTSFCRSRVGAAEKSFLLAHCKGRRYP
jgi:hypothetical protein